MPHSLKKNLQNLKGIVYNKFREGGFFMDPITNQIFSYDFDKFVLQTPNVFPVNQQLEVKPFNLNKPAEKTEKNKKDLKKSKDKEKEEKKKN